MKKIFKTVICIFVIILNINIVYASEATKEKCESLKFKMLTLKVKENNHNGVVMYYSDGKTENKESYEIFSTSNNSVGYAAYCRDASETLVGTRNKSTYSFKCEETTITFKPDATNKNDLSNNAYNSGIMAILENSKYNLKGNDDEYIATNLALRVFEMLNGNLNNMQILKNDNTQKSVNYYYNEFIKDSRINKLLNKLKNIKTKSGEQIWNVRKEITSSKNIKKVSKWTYNGNTVDIPNRAKQLVIDGINAAIYALENGIANIKIETPTVTAQNYFDDSGNKIYKKTITYTLNAKNFKSNEKDIKIDFNCSNCSEYGVTTDYMVFVDNKYKEISNLKSTNFAGYLSNGSGKIELKVTFAANANNYNCDELKYKLNVKYIDDTIDVETYNVSYNGTNGKYQKLYVLYAKDSYTERTIEDKIKLCDSNNPDDGTDPNNLNCTTYIGNTSCTAEDSNISITEGYDVDPNNCNNISEENNLNVLQCIINKSDVAGNSYKASNLVSNEFCSVYCKEDYHLTLPGQKEVNSGRYFSLNAKVEGTKTCYTSLIADKYTLQEKLTAKEDSLREAYETWNSASKSGNSQEITKAKNSLNSVIKQYVDMINSYNSCSGKNTITYDEKLNYSNSTGWEMNYNYDPKISFNYEETYMNKALKKELETVGNITKGQVMQQVCTGSTNKSYSSCSNTWKESGEFSDVITQYICKQDGNSYKCGNENILVSNATYVKQTISVSASYITPTQFYTIYPTGAIVVSENGSNSIENASELTNKLPVGLGTTQGVYNYTLKVSNLGEYYDKSSLGRIWGNDNSVVVNVLKDSEDGKSCVKEGALTENVNKGNIKENGGVYVCAYKVNCPDCPVECDPTCKNPNCPDGNCPVECENCIYTNASSNVSYKPISPGNINPNDREMGKNWKYDDKSISTALELKAYVTTKEIEEKGETIYDVDYEDTSTNNDNDFAMKITLDSALINKIKAYNDEHEKDGGYANNTLKCYDYVQDGVTYDNIYCYSTFIDELLYDNSSKDKITISGNRIIGTNAESSDTLRKSKTQDSGYWTTWTQSNTNKWNVTTENGIAYYKKNYSEIGIGPSWK